MSKESVFTVKLETDLRDAFMAEAAATHRPASQLVREFMRDFVRHQRESRKHDAWFRAKVRQALNEEGPVMSHEAFMDETRALIDRIAAEKAKA
jgi:predicted transcriptional regulator